jgi:hypothetical protein
MITYWGWRYSSTILDLSVGRTSHPRKIGSISQRGKVDAIGGWAGPRPGIDAVELKKKLSL